MQSTNMGVHCTECRGINPSLYTLLSDDLSDALHAVPFNPNSFRHLYPVMAIDLRVVNGINLSFYYAYSIE